MIFRTSDDVSFCGAASEEGASNDWCSKSVNARFTEAVKREYRSNKEFVQFN